MDDRTDIEDDIAASAASAKSVTVDGTTTTEHPLTEKVEADRYLRANRGGRRAGLGVAFRKIVPHGAV